jgi:LDH2 family malate/lactate/ureidoglycolate dehydrogenase
MKIAVDDLRLKMLGTLKGRFSSSDSERIVDALLWADMAGIATMGVIKLTGTEPLQDIVPKHEVRVEKETPVSALINAGANPAPLVAQDATDRAIEKAKATGLAIVGVHNMFSSTGAQAFYARRIADAGFIGIVQSSPTPSTAAFGGIEPLFGTNPIAFSFPTLGEPLIFDMTTSAMTWYGLVLASAQGASLPQGVAIDAEGNETTDPTAAMKGALLPFGNNHKGAGMAMIVEILGGLLAGADYCAAEGEWGSSFIVIDPEVLIGRDEFRRRCSDMVTKLKSARTLPNVEDIRLPGERAASRYKESLNTGLVEVDEAILTQLGYV